MTSTQALSTQATPTTATVGPVAANPYPWPFD
jgi:hypothetical protein